MNLLLRLIGMLVKALRAARIGILDQSRLSFHVWPNDLDTNLHMNNGRYLTVMDLGRMDLVIRSGLLKTMMKRRWMPMLGGAMIRYRRSLQPFQRYQLTTRLVCWDEKWLYMEQRFITTDGKLAAIAMVRGLFRSAEGNVPSAELLRLMNTNTASPPIPPAIAAWVSAEEALGQDL